MSRTHIQQSQISGSLEASDSVALADLLKANRTLVDDLDSIRSQLKRVMGTNAWTDALDGSQDLADIYAAIHVSGTDADVIGALDVAGQVDLAAAGLATNVRGTLSVAEVATFSAAMTGSAGMKLAGDLDVNSSADFQGAVNLQSTLDVAGTAHFAGLVDVDGTLSASVIKIDGDSPAGALYLVGAAGEIAESASLMFDGSSFSVTGGITGSAGLQLAGDMNVDGHAVMNDGLTVSGDRLEVTGSFGLTGAAEIGGALDVDGAVTFGSTLEVVGGMSGSAGLKIAGDADFNSSADFQGAVNMQSTLDVAQLATFNNGIAVNNAVADFNAGITATSVAIDGDVAGRLYIVDGSGYISDEANLNFSGGELQVTGSLKVTAGSKLEGTLDVSGAADFGSTVEIQGATTMIGALDVDGAVDFDSTLNVQGNAVFQADVQIDGDLYVKGATTYIQTENLKVQDAFIYLATGSNGGVDSGIVLSRGAGAGHDLVIGQDGGAGEVVFAKVAYNEFLDTPADIDGAELVATWMSEVKFGAVEGSLSGSLAAVAGGIELSAEPGKDISLVAGDAAGGGDLLLSANGQTPISFIESGEYTAFNLQFPGQSLVSAIVSAGGNFKQDSFKPGVTTAGASIDFSSVGALRTASYASTAAKKLAMDVYLNGVRLAYSDDYSIDGSGVLSLTMNTMGDDVLTVVIHNAAAA